MIPVVTIATKVTNSGNFTTFFNIIIEGKDNAVTAIMKASTVPIPTPFNTKASAIGKAPKMSAYIGIPTKVASGTENRFLDDKTCVISVSGIYP